VCTHPSDATGNVEGDALLARDSSYTRLEAFHLDHLGTPRLLTNHRAERLAQPNHYPFGEEITVNTQVAERLKFTGHERDTLGSEEVADDLDYMHARFANPITGRFLSVDQIDGASRLAPQSWNRYGYVHGSPLKFTDPDGHLLDVALDIGFIAYDLYDIGRSLLAGRATTRAQWGSLGANTVGAMLPFATGLGATVRAAAKADDAARAARGILHSAEIGRRGEELARAAGLVPYGAVKRAISSPSKTAARRIPDGVDDLGRTIYEVKNTANLRLTNQLGDYLEWAEKYEYRFVLIVRPGVRIAPDLEKVLALYQARGLAVVKRLPY